MSRPHNLLWMTGMMTLLGLVQADLALTQIRPDATLPNPTQVIPGSQGVRIDGGTQAGGNLFHSFIEFSVPTDTQVLFNNPLEVQNIFSRVTGSHLSQIDGLIQANGNANLFLMNPNGIIFGPNARLNLGGSFVASTANSIQFQDGSEFSATQPVAPPLLTINVPIGLQFSGANHGSIRVQGSGHGFNFNSQTGALEPNAIAPNLAVQPGKTLALVSPEISLEGGNLRAEAGAIELWAVTRGSLPLELTREQLGFNNSQPLAELGTIQLSGAASVDTSGFQGGVLQVQSRNLRLEAGSVMVSVTQGSQPGRNARIGASEGIQAIGRTAGGRIGSGFLVRTNGAGAGGNLTITTPSLIVQDGAAIATGTDSSGNSGVLRVEAREVFLGGLSASGARLTSLSSNPTTNSTGVGGDIIIEAEKFSIENGAVVSVSTFGTATSGNIFVRASDVQIRGVSATGGIGSGFYARTSLNNLLNPAPALTGNAGNVTVIADRLTLSDRGTINVANLGKGNAGNININAATVELDRQSVITATQRQATQGNVTIESQNLQLRNGSTIVTNASNIIVLDSGEEIVTDGQGTDGGNIILNTQILVALEESKITANAQQGFGGRISINADSIFRSPTSEITATSSLGAEFSGSIQINTVDVNPATGLVDLPENFTDLSTQVTQGCAVAQGNNFIVTGRGGLPEDPQETLLGSTVWRDLRPRQGGAFTSIPTLEAASPTPVWVEATGWVKNDRGELELVANAPDGVSPGAWNSFSSCNIAQ